MFTLSSILVWLAGANAHIGTWYEGMYCMNVGYLFPTCNNRLEDLLLYNRVQYRVNLIRIRTTMSLLCLI